LILFIVEFQSSFFRIILGLPFILFSPGYILLAALSINDDLIDFTGRMGLSFVMSVVIITLIGLGLNYTPWGIDLDSILASVSIFIFLVSIIAVLRHRFSSKVVFLTEIKLTFPTWDGKAFSNCLSILIGIALFGTIGVFGYTSVTPKEGEVFTEFYILGYDHKAEEYPTEFLMNNNLITRVIYGVDTNDGDTPLGRVSIGIVNHGRQRSTYSVKIQIDGEPVNLSYNQLYLAQTEYAELEPDEKWEQEVGFLPSHKGANQKVEFLLFKNNSTLPEKSLQIWINVREQE
jgi:uncharacterized membrane protein